MGATKSKRSRTIVFSNNGNSRKKLYAMAVDRYFGGVKDKDERFRKLSPKEERELIEKYRNDRPTLENKLTEHNIFFALNYASRQSYRFNDYDELISLAMNGLRKAATTFDVDKGYRFNTWAAFSLKQSILKRFYVKKESYIDDHVGIYLDSEIAVKIDNPDSEYTYSTLNNSIEATEEEKTDGTFLDKMESDERNKDIRDYAHRIIQSVETSSLSTMDKKIFNRIFIDGYSIHAISKELGVPRNEVTLGKARVLSYINFNFSKDVLFS